MVGIVALFLTTKPTWLQELSSCCASHRVTIVGGGPAGFLEAYLLAAAGHRVTVFEPDTEERVNDLSERTKTYPVCISARG